ncbi:MAG: sorbosone dehydrogenase family protein [Chitinophagaceae bacterium]
MKKAFLLLTGSSLCLLSFAQNTKTKDNSTPGSRLVLPEPSESVRKNSKVIAWPEGKTPVAPDGFIVTKFADNLNTPRWIYLAPNGDILVSESRTGGKSPNDIILLRDNNNDGIVDTRQTFMTGLNRPFGMVIVNNWLYVGNTNAIYRFPYKTGQLQVTDAGQKIMDLTPGGYNNHWTRNIIANKDGSKLYVSVGSGSNVGEHGPENEIRRANILEINPDGSGERVFASGLRNPVGMDWEPVTGALWTAVNERDNLGDELVPDYITSVKDGGFYGWPYSYFGQHEDPRMKGQHPELVAKALIPDVPVGAHTASLGLAFYKKNMFPEKYRGGAFVGQHGSWNRSVFSGYKVVFVPFTNGKPGNAEDFLTGFIANENNNEVYGRPVGVVVLNDGSLLVADDGGNVIWRVSRK